MNFTIQPGVVLRELCGEPLLISTAEAKKLCPAMCQLNETGAFFWKLLEQGFGEEEMIARTVQEFEVEEAHVREVLPAFFAQLAQQHFLIPKG